MAPTWEDYLWHEHHAVAVSPWQGSTGLELLDLMVRRSDHYIKTVGAGLVQIGSFFDFGLPTGEDVENLQPVDKLKEALYSFRHHKTTDTKSTDDSEAPEPIIRRESLSSLTETVNASSKNLASVLKYAKVNNSSSKTMTCTLDGVSVHRVSDKKALNAAIEAWKPNMARLAKYTSPSLWGHADVFLVTDILYAGHVTVENKKSGSIGAGVDSGVAGTLFGVNAAVDVEAERSNGSKRDITGGDIPFAIKVYCLHYNSKGELRSLVPESRSAIQVHRIIDESEVESLPSGVETLPPGIKFLPLGIEVLPSVVREEHSDVHVSKSEVVYRPSETTDVGEGDTNGIFVEVVEIHREGDAPGGRVSETVVVEAPELVEGVQQSEPVAEKDDLVPDEEELAREQAKWEYDPLSQFECRMSDFFGDDLSYLTGADGSAIELTIDIVADSEPAESATVHTS